MSKLTIQTGNDKFEIEGKNIIDLEVKLNITEFGKKWLNIGDHLYKFYTLQGYEGQPPNILNVNEFQYNYLQDLNKREYSNIYKIEKFINK